MRTRVKRMPRAGFSVTSTPFGRSAITWKSLWSPMTTSTFLSAVGDVDRAAPVGCVSVPAVAPCGRGRRSPSTPFRCATSPPRRSPRRAGRSRGTDRADPGRAELGVSAVREADDPDRETAELARSSTAPTPAASSRRRRRRSTTRIGSRRAGSARPGGTARPRSKLWLPSAVDVEPHHVLISIVGLSPKKFEIGGVAPPNESPPVTRGDPCPRRSARRRRTTASGTRRRAIGNVGLTRAGAGDVVRRLGERGELPVPVADVEDRAAP